MILDQIEKREDLLTLNSEQQTQLCNEIRQFLVKNVSKTGGHLASNLGVVELTLAIHRIFDTKTDRLVFDVGHQSYVHKILSGRMEQFPTLRQFGGMAGFPKPSESDEDAFIAGHASNAVSLALGMARARTLAGDSYHVIALLGDGALTGGLAYEGLNNAGSSREPLIVILNDNGMSITPNVGAIAKHLASMRLRPDYLDFKMKYRRATARSKLGRRVYHITHWIKSHIKRSVLGTTFFESLGFTYLGPIDGHDSAKIETLLRVAKQMHEPVLIHVITKKGKGYLPAEKTPQNFHGVGAFDAQTGRPLSPQKLTFCDVMGHTLSSMAAVDERICAITAAMLQGTGLEIFQKNHPERCFDVGIAEEHAVSMAAGLAKQGFLPVVAIYSTFLQRAYDMLLHDVGILGLHVIFCVDRAGLVGADGETHHGIFDVGFLRQVPGMTVFCPANFSELQEMLHEAVYSCTGPVAVRYPRGVEGDYHCDQTYNILNAGTDCTLITYGALVNEVFEAEQLLKQSGISVEILKLGKIAPLDFAEIEASCRKTGRVVIVEEVSDHDCLADEVFSHLLQAGIQVKAKKCNLGGGYLPHGSIKELYHLAGIDAQAIVNAVQEVIRDEK